jgi:hypothetical protein
LTPEAVFNVFPKDVAVFLSPAISSATVLLPSTAQVTVQFLPLWLSLGSCKAFIRPHQAVVDALGNVPRYRAIRQAAIDAGTDIWAWRVCAFAELDLEAEGLCKGNEGVKGPHSGLRGTLQEIVVSVCQGSRQVHLSDLFEWPLQGERKEQRS